MVQVLPLSADFSQDCSTLSVAEAHELDAIEDGFAAGAAAGPAKFGGAGSYLSGEDVDAAVVIGVEALPVFIFRIVGEDILALEAGAALPTFDDEALIESERYFAGAAARRAGIGDGPIAEPEVEEAGVGIFGARRQNRRRRKRVEARDRRMPRRRREEAARPERVELRTF